MPHLSPIAHLRNIAIRSALLAAERADTTHRTKSDDETKDGVMDDAIGWMRWTNEMTAGNASDRTSNVPPPDTTDGAGNGEKTGL